MHLQIKKQITVNTPAVKAWQILAHEFAAISHWASMIPASAALADPSAPTTAQVAGRSCAGPGFGQIEEKFTAYDEAAMRFTYAATAGLPAFFKRAQNTWSVQALGEKQCLVGAHADVELTLLPGLFVLPFVHLYLQRITAHTTEELKYYLEHGQPHPRKRKAQQPGRRTAVHT
ncbi:MAG: SRPBCC family protein [Caldilineaceae bacterium]